MEFYYVNQLPTKKFKKKQFLIRKLAIMMFLIYNQPHWDLGVEWER